MMALGLRRRRAYILKIFPHSRATSRGPLAAKPARPLKQSNSPLPQRLGQS